jgi:small subunit ribosomal protein S6
MLNANCPKGGTMKTNHYESVVIINAALEDEQVDALIERIKEFITTNGGTISDLEKWGRKRLAYPIQKSKSGYYLIVRYTAPRELVAKVERTYRLDENIIRYLTIVLDKKALEHIEKQKAKKEAKVEETAGQENSNNTTNESAE